MRETIKLVREELLEILDNCIIDTVAKVKIEELVSRCTAALVDDNTKQEIIKKEQQIKELQKDINSLIEK